MFLYRLTATLLLASASMTWAGNLRSLQDHQPHKKCTILVGNMLHLEADVAGSDPEFIDCQLDPIDANGNANTVLPMKLNAEQKQIMINLLETGELVSGVSTLELGNDIKIGEDEIIIESGLELAISKKPDSSRRRLAVVTGEKPILVVKVTDAVGKVRSESMAQMSDDVFGTFGDPVNLKSQMYGCSFTQLNITAGNPSVEDDTKVVNGVTEVTIGVTLEGNSRSTIRNAVTTAVQSHLGITLPGPYQQVMYVLEGCYQDCGWAAYAYINSWNSVYQGGYYYMTGVQMHELGHNFNLAHSGGLDGATYTDHTGLMGNPLYSDDVGKMCWNAAKTWQIGWYDSNKKVIDPRATSRVIETLVGIANFDSNDAQHPVVLKIETGTSTDQFIAFNRATGVNSQNDQADNQVTIVETGENGESYSQSYLKATLVQGGSYTFQNWAGTGEDLVIVAETITLVTNPGYATVSITLGTAETTEPSASPSASPSISNFPTSNPTESPAPSSNPSATPTRACSGLSKNDCNNELHCKYSGKLKTCIDADGGGGSGGGGGGGCGFCSATGAECCGTCVSKGRQSSRGCFD